MSIEKRLHACAAIGGPYVDQGLGARHADAHFGLMNGTLEAFTSFAKAIPDWEDLPMVALVATIVLRDEQELENRAAVLQWTRRKAAYDADRASWKACESDKGDGWRALPMTAPQRFLIADTAAILEIEIPAGMDRGMASDWLDANGANVIRQIEGDRR